jgi:hypothetical protein
MQESEQGKPHIIPALYHALKIRYFVKTVTDLNCIIEQFGWRLISDNASYCLVQNHLPSCLLQIDVKINIYSKTKILPLLLHVCETWYVILKNEHKLRIL